MPDNQGPSPEQIAAACAEIRAGWSDAERMKRLRFDWRPVVNTADGREVAMTAESYDVHHATEDDA
jgi:hypothetical protein